MPDDNDRPEEGSEGGIPDPLDLGQFSAFRISPGLEHLRGVSKVASEVMGVTNPAALREAMKPINEMGKSLIEIQGRSGITDALKSIEAARGIMGPHQFMHDRIGLSAEAMNWQAEKAAAPVETRDAVWALADAVESLAESQRRADEWQRTDAEARRRATNLQITISVAALVLPTLLVLKEFL